MTEAHKLRPDLSLRDAAAIVAGSMIGSGIFIVSADITRQTGSPAGLLAIWIASGLMTIAGALAYGELAAMMPQAGGQYVFLSEAYGEHVAFSFGWTLLLVIQTGTIAAVAVAFGRFAGVLWPVIGERVVLGYGRVGLSGERVMAIAIIAFLTGVNLRGLAWGKLVQNLFTSTKIVALLMIVIVGCLLAPNHAAVRANFGSPAAFLGPRSLSLPRLAVFGAAMVGGLFSSDAWASVTFAASEVRNPGRDLPRALALGTTVVIALYVLTNLAYLAELPAPGIAGATHDRVAAAAMQVVWDGKGATIIALIVMVSTFGCANGLILTGARVVYRMARDGLFFASAGRLNRASVPGAALIAQGGWAALLALSGAYSDLLDYVIFAQLLFYVLTVGAVFILRRTRPHTPRPYRAWGYPIVPAAYLAAAVALMADLLIMRPLYTWPGLLIALSAFPVYAMIARHRSRLRAAPVAAAGD